MYSVNDIFMLRLNQPGYIWFCNTILPEILSIDIREFFNVSQKKKFTTIVTVSDEAFALLCFKNYFNCLKYKVEMVEKQTIESSNGNDMPRENTLTNNTIVKPLYTRAGATAHQRVQSGWFKYSGWSEEGIEEFNNLFDSVTDDRKKYPNFDEIFLKKQLEIARNKWNLKFPNNKNMVPRKKIVEKTSWV